jgi:predicted ATPase
MKLQGARIRDFKRFTDLTVESIPASARLVVLVGPNGSGKSSLFEAFNFWISPFRGVNYQMDYHAKAGSEVRPNWDFLYQKVELHFHGQAPNPQQQSETSKKAFYFRSAYRNEPDFNTNTVQKRGDPLDDQNRPPLLISPDSRVSDNYQRIVADAVAEVFRHGNDRMAKGELRERLIGKVRHAMRRVFDGLVLEGPGDPMTDGTFFFEKGASRGWRYKNLSGGEKAAFDLLLDFTLKAQHCNDTIFYIDEPETHMHSRLQGKLLDELVSQLPASCQLWIATHSIGMVRRSLDLHRANPSEVVFLDFEGRNFDEPQTLAPIVVNRVFWKRVFHVALDDIAELVGPRQIVFCEGAPVHSPARRNTEFDAKVYRTIFTSTYPDAEFISLGGANDVERDAVVITTAIGQAFTGIEMRSLLDRDDRSEQQVAELGAQGKRVLSRRTIESFLWDDEILRKLCHEVNRDDIADEIVKRKHDFLAASAASGNPPDDVKRVAGQLYVEIVRALQLRQQGNTPEALALARLAPLITPDTGVYKELERAIFRDG